MNSQSDFYRNILHNLSDGAMAVDFEGKITLFNPAGVRIFGIESEETVVGRKFAEVFMLEIEGSDDFNQVVLDAVNHEKVGQSRVVKIQDSDGQNVVLKVKSSLLQDESGEKQGVVVVFTDITYEKHMQEEQERLNRDLQQAYVDMENTNSSLRSALKKVRVVRRVVLLVVVLVFIGLGMYTWKKVDINELGSPEISSRRDESGLNAVPVQSQPVASSISLSGKLEPLEKVNLLCPYNARIKDKHVDFGQRVDKDDLLLTLSSEELQEQYRSAQGELIQARQDYEKLLNWKKSTEYAKAKRALSKAKYQLEQSESKLKEAKLLHENGIMSKNNLQRARDEVRNARMTLIDSRESLQAVQAKAEADKIKIVKFKFKNAQAKYERIKKKLEQSRVTAPVSGVVLHPLVEKDKKYSIAEGSSFSEGDILLTVGDMEGLSISTEVDEVDVQKVEPGQKVKVKGEGFSEVTFEGFIDQVSTVAKDSSGSDLTVFPVRVVIPELDAAERKKIRLGMTANMQVQVYSNPQALLVPIDAVRITPQGNFVQIRDEKGERKEVEVETGITTMRMVEIKKGLAPDDKVIVP